jgi:hypothetical protein
MKLIIQDDAGHEVYRLAFKARNRLWRELFSAILDHYWRKFRSYKAEDAFCRDFVNAVNAAVDENSRNHPKGKNCKRLIPEVDYPVTERGDVFHTKNPQWSLHHLD